MNRGLNGFLINRRLEGQAKEQINQDVNLEVYEIPDSDFSAASGTVNLPKNGKWLLVGIYNIFSGNSLINGVNITSGTSGGSFFSIQINGANFTYSKGNFDTLYRVRAIRLGDP
jgi:hypothetical protein